MTEKILDGKIYGIVAGILHREGEYKESLKGHEL